MAAALAPLSHLIPDDNVRTFTPPTFREDREGGKGVEGGGR